MKPAPADALAELQRVTAALSAASSAEHVGRVVTEVARDAMGAESGALWVMEGDALLLVSQAGSTSEFVDQFRRIPLDSSIPAAETVQSREPRWIESEEAYERTSPAIAANARAAGKLRPYAALPLLVEDRMVGIVAWNFPSWRPFEDTEKLFIQTVASHCAQAIDRAHLFEKVRATEERLRLALEAGHVGAWSGDVRTGVNSWDARCFEILGVPSSEPPTSEAATRSIHPDDRAAYRAAIDRARDPAGDGVLSVVFRRIGAGDGAERWVDLRGRVLFVDGVAGRSLGTLLDVTDAKRAEAERADLLERERAARAEAERANRMKDEFLAVLSHELRTPLNAIVGWTHLLRDDAMAPDRRAHALAVIERNAHAQEQLISDLFDMNRITSGRLRLASKAVDARAVLTMALDAVRPSAAAKKLTLETSIDDGVGRLVGDADRLQQVARNLLTNAVKFTPSGGRVRVSLERVGDDAVVSVADTGKGIHPDFLPHLFQSFRQGDASAAREVGGLGLGLAISKTLVEMHGGTIAARSDGVGRGAEFIVRLPLATSDANAARGGESARGGASSADDDPGHLLRGVDILIVEDDVDAREVLLEVLESHGARVSTASTAAEAFEKFLAGSAALIVSDVGLPGEDGLSLIRRLRATPAGARVPAIAITAFTRPEDRERALAAGFDRYFPKPVDVFALIDAAGHLVADAR